MRHITKSFPPRSFADWKSSQPDASWRALGGTEKEELKSFLIEEQFGLCGYCEQAVSDSTSHIEHLTPQSRAPELALEYRNLLASCDNPQTCGKAKAADEIDVTPFDDDVERAFDYILDGRIAVRRGYGRPEEAERTLATLRLDHPSLVQRRRSHIETLLQFSDDELKMVAEEVGPFHSATLHTARMLHQRRPG